MEFDTIIVGGGSAGSVLAHRLSARSNHRVLLCESGPDTPPGQEPTEILDSYPGITYFDPRWQWNKLMVSTETRPHNDPGSVRPKLRKYEQARVLGGGSSINGLMANRGAPTDYDEWEARGAHGWGWRDVLPYFRKVERDTDFDGPLHGKDGRIPVSRIWQDRWPGHAKACAESFKQAGYEYLEDQNGEFREGYFPSTFSGANDKRVSAAMGYLDRETRARPNLTISTDTHVTKLVFDGLRCIGIEAMVKGQPQSFRAHEIILSSGAMHTPAHLLRAGIGPAGHLRDLGIPVLVAKAGVGQRLMDHPSVAVSAYLKKAARLGNITRRHTHVAMRYSSGIGGAPAGDMFVASIVKSAWHDVGECIGSLLIFVNKTYSETGQVKLASPDWREEPIVEFNLLSDQRDTQRMMDGVRRLAHLHTLPGLRDVTEDAFPASYSDRIRQAGVVNTKNKILTSILAKLLDGPAPLRRSLIKNLILDEFDMEGVLRSDEQCEAFVRKAAVGIWHASASCRMGADNDPMAVVDSVGRVRGVEGLRVVDASIFPVVPCANTNFPTLMTAEKISDAIIAGQ